MSANMANLNFFYLSKWTWTELIKCKSIVQRAASHLMAWICFVWYGFLTPLSTTRLYHGRAPRQSIWQFYALPHMRQSWETMTSVSAGHIIMTPTQPVGSGQPPHRKPRALPTELQRSPMAWKIKEILKLIFNEHSLNEVFQTVSPTSMDLLRMETFMVTFE